MKIIFGALLVLAAMLGAVLGLMLAAWSVGQPKAQTRAVVVWPNGRVDIDWRSVEHCQTDLCRVARSARCK